jgi:hypothetical protein
MTGSFPSRSSSTLLLVIGALAGALVPQRITAQAADILHGRVTDDSSRAIVATVIITRGPDRLVQQTTTDSAGAFRLSFDPGTGDYLVYASAVGYTAARRRVQREGSEHEFVVNLAVHRDVTQLAAVKIRVARPVRATNRIRPTQPETGAAERWADGIDGQVSPTESGNLDAIAGTMSNIAMTEAGPSVLGSAAESNLTTLNGMAIAAGSMPRAARTQTRVTAATFDPTRGGFTGANIDVQLGPGDRMFQSRRAYLTLAPAPLQLIDAVGRASGAQSNGIRASVGADGELIRKAMTYNVAADIAHRVSKPSTLLDANEDILSSAGVAADSVTRLIEAARLLGIPLSNSRVPTSRTHDAFTWLGRLDDTRDTLKTRALTSIASYTRDGARGAGVLTAPAATTERTETTLGSQLTLGSYIGPRQLVLTETRLAASAVRTHVTPYAHVPGAYVLIRSPDTRIAATGNAGDAGNVELTSVALGGSQVGVSDDTRWTLEGSNMTIWNTNGSRNKFKALVWGRADGVRQRGIPNSLGTFSFNSVADLSAGRASSYSRTLSQPTREGSVWNAAAAFVHEWAPSRTFSLLYGARIEADGFMSAPGRNAALENALGLSADVAPMRMHVSPRAGFSYTYNRERGNSNGMSASPVGLFYRNTLGVIRGGIGEFRDLLRPDMLAGASATTALVRGTAVLSCTGEATPVPDWTSFNTSPGSVPAECLDGSGPLVELAPHVIAISPSYDVPHSWRGSLDWSTGVGSWLFRLAMLGSYDLSQPGTVDANFAGVSRLTLGAEGNRPVFVGIDAIDASSGAVSPAEARRSAGFGRVSVRTSDLRGYGGQITATISPDVYKFRSVISLYTSASYTLQRSLRQYRGFDGAAFGDPRIVEWAPSTNDARHVLVLSGGINTARTGTITLFARMQSGFPFSPIVQGDVNGDGMSGDRAFIPNPATTPDVTLANQVRSLMADGASTARSCVLDNLGRVSALNGCRGPWTTSLNMQWRPPIPRKWLGRTTATVYFENVLGGLDQLMHGNNLHGWGAQPSVDPVFLVPRGFDPATQRFSYDVNSRFADTRTANTLVRNPFRITLDFSFNLSTDFSLQQLRRAVEPVRRPTGEWGRRPADSLTAFYLAQTSSIYKYLIANSDSLFLTRQQIASLQRADSVYSDQVRGIYRDLAEYLSARNGRDPGKAELARSKDADRAYWRVFWAQPDSVAPIISLTQRELLPSLKAVIELPKESRNGAETSFGYPVTFANRRHASG